MTLHQAEQTYFDMIGETPCSITMGHLTLEDMDQSIADCLAMLSHAITTNNKSEIAFWRKMLQQAKVQRREILTA